MTNVLAATWKLIYKLKYAAAISAFATATILITLRFGQFSIPDAFGIWCCWLPGGAIAGLFGAICASLVLKWQPKQRLLAVFISFLIPFAFYALPAHVIEGVHRIWTQMTSSSPTEFVSLLRYVIFEYALGYFLPGLIGGVVVVLSTKSPITVNMPKIGPGMNDSNIVNTHGRQTTDVTMKGTN
jgi:hypothetical protein